MEAIVSKQSWPKFLRVNGVMERVNLNNYLLKPWVKGEIVKVLPYEEQKSGEFSTPTDAEFRKRYVSVMRKDGDGKWALKYTWNWDIFEALK